MKQEALTVKTPFTVKSVTFQRKQFGVYLYRKEIIDDSLYGGDGELPMANCYDLKNGCWIGDPKSARRLVKEFGIREFYPRTRKSITATIGYNPKSKRWFGWSHRAIASYKTRAEAERFAKSVS